MADIVYTKEPSELKPAVSIPASVDTSFTMVWPDRRSRSRRALLTVMRQRLPSALKWCRFVEAGIAPPAKSQVQIEPSVQTAAINRLSALNTACETRSVNLKTGL